MIFILLPAYNEELGITVVLRRLVQVASESSDQFRVVVVNDGSTDKTDEAVLMFEHKLDIKLIQFEQNRGVAEVFKEGFKYICSQSKDAENDICISLDSDNTMDARRIPALIAEIRNGSDLVIASRFKGDGKMLGCSFFRYLYSIGLSVLMQTFIRLPNVKDYSIFYRAYRVQLLRDGFDHFGDDLISGHGFSAIGGLLIKLGQLTSKIEEVPLILRYGKKRGVSGIKTFITVRGYLNLINQYLFTKKMRKKSSPEVIKIPSDS